ncbi:hypothetical protein [Xenorhabdus japonica]|uniref:Uncharacterized protein n=1 Tax=Xenorhabdus japonica TaxID=53341 RepID=A0A1I5DK82_9GAMM|nr:hypothetical protein [Xenorhabdus japonica]SFN99622.1 hypothetical protein SAMN05421579_1422 [Xenorhabdus japonica]
MKKSRIINLPERKYFPLHKIEREIGIPCDLEDLIHYAVIGELEICVKVNWQNGFDMDSIEADGMRVFSRYNYVKATEALTLWNGEEPPLTYIELAYETDVTLIEEQIRYNYKQKDLEHRAIEINGLFALSNELFRFSENKLLKGDIFNEAVLTLPKSDNYKIYDLTARAEEEGIDYKPTAISGIKYPVSIDKMLITKTELQRFINGNMEHERTEKEIIKTPHGNGERFAAKREAILMAAMYIQKKYPDRCNTYTEWAKQIDLAALEFWPQEGKPPLEIESIERLLSKVYNPSKWNGN